MKCSSFIEILALFSNTILTPKIRDLLRMTGIVLVLLFLCHKP